MRTPHRLAGVCALLLPVVLSAALVTTLVAAPSTASAEPPRKPREAPLRIATFNTEVPQSDAKALRDITMLAAKRPDVLALQEMSSPERRRLVREQLVDCESCVYDAYMPSLPVPGGTPVLYRSDRFTLLGAETVQVAEPTYVGRAGAGPSTMHAKFINVVRLRDNESLRKINIFNNHAVPTVQGPNGGPNRRMPVRLSLYRKHMRGLVATLARVESTYGGYSFVTGDLNVNFRRDRVLKPRLFPYYNMGLAKLRASFDVLGEPARGTHVLPGGNASRLIDYVYADTRRPVRPIRQEIVMGATSDHRPLVVDYKLRYVRPFAPAPAAPVAP